MAVILAEQTRSRRRSLVERRRLGASSLELPEVRVRRKGHRRVPQLAGFLAARDLRQHWAEERDAVDVNRRRADVLADGIHALVVALAQRLVVLVAARGL